jgi:hypothetical protein
MLGLRRTVGTRSRYRREFVAWPEQVSFFLAHATACPQLVEADIRGSEAIRVLTSTGH